PSVLPFSAASQELMFSTWPSPQISSYRANQSFRKPSARFSPTSVETFQVPPSTSSNAFAASGSACSSAFSYASRSPSLPLSSSKLLLDAASRASWSGRVPPFPWSLPAGPPLVESPPVGPLLVWSPPADVFVAGSFLAGPLPGGSLLVWSPPVELLVAGSFLAGSPPEDSFPVGAVFVGSLFSRSPYAWWCASVPLSRDSLDARLRPPSLSATECSSAWVVNRPSARLRASSSFYW